MSNGSTSSTIELFQSTLSSRRATPNPITPSTATMDFNPRSPHGERPPFPREGCPSPPYFNPRSPHGERPVTRNNHAVEKRFQSTLSSRRATVLLINCIPLRQFQSTLSSRRATGLRPGKRVQTQHFNPRSPHGERHPICGYISIKKLISIHALLTESDYCRSSRRRGPHYFNPRSPHGERLKPARIPMRLVIFQSTLSSRRATFCGGCCASWISANFNPRSPHGERPVLFAREGTLVDISIHALLTESDLRLLWDISIVKMNFNPRSPHGERRYEPGSLPLEIGFQSTLSSRRATRCPNCLLGTQEISIHALLTESDPPTRDSQKHVYKFQSTLSSRRATTLTCAGYTSLAFQSTLSSRRAT